MIDPNPIYGLLLLVLAAVFINVIPLKRKRKKTKMTYRRSPIKPTLVIFVVGKS